MARLDGADLRGAPDPLLDGGSCPTGTARKVAAALKPVYTASSADAAAAALDRVRGQSAGARYPDTVGVWERAWERFTPFLALPPALRRVISSPTPVGGAPSTNSIESLNYQLRKVTKNRGHFPCDAAAVKLLWPAGLQHRGQASR